MDPAILQRHAAHTHGRPPDGTLERRLDVRRMLDDARDATTAKSHPSLQWASWVWPRSVIAALVAGDPGRRRKAIGRRHTAGDLTFLDGSGCVGPLETVHENAASHNALGSGYALAVADDGDWQS